MGKHRRSKMKTRAEPDPTVQWMVSTGAHSTLCVPGYTRLSENPEVKTCVSRIAELVASMTLHLMESGENGDTRLKNELSRKLDINPYLYMTRFTWIYNIVSTMLLEGKGNAVVLPIFEGNLIADLMPLQPSKVSFVADGHAYQVHYDGKRYQWNDVLHFVFNPDPDKPYLGRGYEVYLKDVVANLKQAQATKKGFMSDEWKPSVIVSVDANSDELASEDGRSALLERYMSESGEGKPWVIPGGLIEVKTLTPLSIKDLAIPEGMTLDKQTVAGLIGVPAFFLGVGNYNKDEYNSFVSSKVLPIAKIIEQELTKKLLLSPNLYFRFNPRTLYNYSLTELTAAGIDMVDRMAMRRNELRDWLGMSPDPEMDELLALENFLPVTELGNQKKLKDKKGGGAGGA